MSYTNIEAIEHMANELVELAKRCEVVITIDTKPRQPLAMGHYDMVVNVRVARAMAEPIVRQA